MQIEALMSKSIAACSPNDSLSTAAQIMWDRDVGFLPVIEPDGRVVGTITDRDIAMGGFMNDAPLSHVPVWRVMSANVFAVQPETGVEEVEKLMRSHRIRRIPVVDSQGRLEGVVSMTDFARAASNPSRRDQVRSIDVASLFAQIATGSRDDRGDHDRRRSEMRA